MRLPFWLIFIALPLVEIYLFIVVGSEIGALPVIALILITALVGIAMLKNQGYTSMERFGESLTRGEPLEEVLAKGFFLCIGGILLLIPGFFTDAIGLLCVLPLTHRIFIIKYLLPHLNMRRTSRRRRRVSGRIIDIGKEQDDTEQRKDDWK